MLECVFFFRIEMSFLEKEDVVAFGKSFYVSYYVAVARALNLVGGVVGEGVEVIGDTRGRWKEGGGRTARWGDRHWDQDEDVEFGER